MRPSVLTPLFASAQSLAGVGPRVLVLLKKALQINPDGIDPNYFYGDFLYRQGRTDEALQALEKALQAPARPARTDADAGRRHEIQALIARIKSAS